MSSYEATYDRSCFPLFLRAEGADVEDNESSESEEEFEVGEDGGKVSMNQLPGHGMSTGNDPTYDPYTIGAKHGFGNRGEEARH